jgi:CubicO group peptidase (beta-lactamase class C family)
MPPKRTKDLRRLSPRSLERGLAQLIRKQMKATGTPGVAVGVMHRGRAYAQGFGLTNIEAPADVDTETLFQIGSTGKTFTAAAVMRLVDRGDLDLDAPIRRYVKNLKFRDEDVTRRVTLRHLLTHTGGWAGDFFEDEGRGDDALDRYIGRLKEVPQLTPLGETWHYNNAGFTLAGHILAKATDMPYEQAIMELLLDPLGMTNSVYYLEDALVRRVAVGHIADGKKQTRIARWWGMRALAPAGGMVSDVIDQLRWAWFNLGDGRAPDGKRLLKKSTMRQMQRPQAEAGNLADHVGYSWLLEDVDGVRLVSHGGTTVGQLSAFSMVPEMDLAVTSMTNSTSGRSINRSVVGWVLKNYAGVERTPPVPGPATEEDLLRYEGSYVDAFQRIEISLEATARRLEARIAPLDSGATGPLPKPFRIALVDEDRAVQTTGELKGLRIEFLRDKGNRVAWMRFGGRLYRRKRPRKASKK